jgi:uncharacterized membrane protein YdbT with pleckstrin-like domain
MAEETGKKIMWKDRKRTLFGLPWSFTKYSLTEEKLCISRGFFTSTEDEIRLYRVLDLTLRRTLGEKLWGLGTIHVCSADRSTPEFDIKRVKNSQAVKDLLSDLVEQERQRKKTYGKELFGVGEPSLDGLDDMDGYDGGDHFHGA